MRVRSKTGAALSRQMPQRIANECIRFVLFWGTFLGTVTAVHEVVGEPPVLTSEPADVVVFQQDTMLACAATGSPEPTIRWFRGPDQPTPEELSQDLIQQDGSLLLANITEGLTATRDGTPYYCTATNIIGPGNASVTVRSRIAIVTFAFFDGFDDTIQSNIPVTFFEGMNARGDPSLSNVALECGIQGASPPPNIVWFRGSDVMTNGMQIPDEVNDRFFFLENGRYLFIRDLVIDDIDNIQYQCGVTNALLDQEMRSPIIYSLDRSNFTLNQLVRYKEIGTVVGLVGGTAMFSFVGAAENIEQCNNLVISYNSPVDGTTLTVSQTSVVGSVTAIPSDLSGGSFAIRGTAVGAGLSVNIDGTLQVFNPAQATRAPDEDLRELIAGEREVTLTCQVEGSPDPELLWYYNGAPVTDPGVSIASNTLTIPSPAVSHTGIYQCFVRNDFGDDSVTWVLAIREPVALEIRDPLESNLGSTHDRREGTVVVVDNPLVSVTISLDVIADPCPVVIWTLNGDIEVVTTNGLYEVVDPCASNPDRTSPNRFSVVLPNLTTNNSGSYVATFINFAGNSSTAIFVTPPVPVSFESVSLEIQGSPDATCLLSGSDATITCNVEGFPRPEIDFLIGWFQVQPGTERFERVTRIEADQIFVENLQLNDGDRYGCRVANDSTATITQQTYIYCTNPGISTLSVRPAEIVEGVRFTITCAITGVPLPDISWMKNGNVLVPSEDLRIVEPVGMLGTSLVEASNAVVSFSGRYECVARNSASSFSRSILVEVGAAPNSLITCGPPTLASGVVLEAPVSSTAFGSTFSFRCEEGLVPSATFEAVCGADSQWSPDPTDHACACVCTTGTELSTGSAVAITAVLCTVVFFMGVLGTLLMVYCITAKRAQYSVSNRSTEPQTPAPDPVYDDIPATDTLPKAIELNEYVAYGPARQ